MAAVSVEVWRRWEVMSEAERAMAWEEETAGGRDGGVEVAVDAAVAMVEVRAAVTVAALAVVRAAATVVAQAGKAIAEVKAEEGRVAAMGAPDGDGGAFQLWDVASEARVKVEQW